MHIHIYDNNFYFLRSEELITCPLENSPSIPLNSTLIEPLPVIPNTKIKFAAHLGQWVYEESPQLTAEDIQNMTISNLTKSLEEYYDKVAQVKRYDNRLTCALRAGYAGPFQTEGHTFAIWMDNCNAYGYQVLAECLAGTRGIPTPKELILEFPTAPW